MGPKLKRRLPGASHDWGYIIKTRVWISHGARTSKMACARRRGLPRDLESGKLQQFAQLWIPRTEPIWPGLAEVMPGIAGDV
ncbi:MAG TPA: hypothetical protein VH083_04330, partial [Myxococcales bacterium]|nr:hypothetical protein [Myxococcales bacterium]